MEVWRGYAKWFIWQLVGLPLLLFLHLPIPAFLLAWGVTLFALIYAHFARRQACRQAQSYARNDSNTHETEDP